MSLDLERLERDDSGKRITRIRQYSRYPLYWIEYLLDIKYDDLTLVAVTFLRDTFLAQNERLVNQMFRHVRVTR